MYEIKYHREVLKDLGKVPNNIVERIGKIIKDLVNNPLPWGHKKLSGKLNAYRIRVGDYRIVYIIDSEENQIKIMRVRHRKEVYRGL